MATERQQSPSPFKAGSFRPVSTNIATEIHVDAPAEAVGALLCDGPGWRDWCRGLYFLDPLVVGRSARMRVKAGPLATPMRVKVASCGDGEVRWTGGIPGVFFGNHWLRWEAGPGGEGTIVRHGEEFDGALARLMFPLLRRQLEPLYQQINRDLRSALS